MKKWFLSFVTLFFLTTNIYANNITNAPNFNNSEINNNFNKLKNELLQLNRLFIQMERAKKDKEKLEIESLNKKIEKLRLERSYVESKFSYDKKILRTNSKLIKENIKKVLSNLYKWKEHIKNSYTIFVPENISNYEINGKKYYFVKYLYIQNAIKTLEKNIFIKRKLDIIISILKTYLNVNEHYLLIYNESITNLIDTINFIIKNNVFRLSDYNTMNNNNGYGQVSSNYVRIYSGMPLSDDIYVKKICDHSITLFYKI